MGLGRLPLATWALLAVNVAVFLGLLEDGASLLLVSPAHLERAGAVAAPLVWRGEVWRLLTGMFVHGAVWHLGLNMWVLWQVGRVLEPVLGTLRFLLVYLASGLTGFALSLLLRPALSAGASGAIFGAVGGLLALAVLTRETPLGRYLLRALSPFVVATLVIGYLLPLIDNAAHVGGLVLGFVLSYGLFADEKGARLAGLERSGMIDADEVVALVPRFATASLVVALAAFALITPLALKPWFSPHYHASLGLHALRVGELEEARRRAGAAEARGANDPAVLLLRGRLHLEDEDEPQALAFFREAAAGYGEEPRLTLVLALHDAGIFDMEEALFGDERLTAGLCAALLGDELAGPALLLNDCAWLLLKATRKDVHDPVRGRRLARLAVQRAEASGADKESLAAILHTLAEAKAQTGAPAEAKALMERIFAGPLSKRPLYREEHQRFEALHKRQAFEDAAREAQAPAGAAPRH
jgi:membrane associated rhomboid family serine protease